MNYTWDLTKLIKDENEFNEAINKIEELLSKLLTYKDKILESNQTLLETLNLDKEIDMLITRLYVYSYLGYYEKMDNVKFQEYKEKIEALFNKISSTTSFVNPELLSCDYSLIEKYIKENKKLEIYEKQLIDIFRYKSHILSEKEEKILSDVREALKTSEDAYDAIDNIDIKFGKVKNEDGEKVELTPYNYNTFLTSKNKKVRHDAFKKEYKYYKEHINTISALYIGNIKSDVFMSKTRKYDSVLDSALFGDKISKKTYKTLIKTTNKNLKALKDYYRYKSQKVGYKIHMSDLYLNTAEVPAKKIKYEEAIKIVNEALSPLGSDYLKNFNYLLNNRCVDVYPKDKKRSGAYEWGTYGVDPYVSLNYENNIDSVSTFAHEMGHAMHTFYSNKNQDYLYASYPIFLAEIASTVNEILLSDYLYKEAKTKEEKIYYLVEFLDKFKATVYRQVMFADFEMQMHEKYENGEVLTKDLLCDIYYKLNKKHFSGAVVVDKDIMYEWARIPHFYTSFYVYKYATGFISALIIADKLEHDTSFKNKYIKFLSSGSYKYPLELLDELGIDITSENVLQKAFDLFNEKLRILKDLEGIE